MADDKKYEVEPSGENIRTIFDYHGDISSFIDWAEEKSMTVKKLEDEYQDVLDSVKVYSAGKVKFVAAEHGDYYRVLLIRTSKDDTTVDDYLKRGKFVQINHGKKEFTIRDKQTKIIAKGEIYDSAKYEEELMPDSNYKFYHDKKLVATMFLDFYNSEMTDVNPTINSFDVEEGGEEYKKTIIHGVEEMLGKQGFKKIWITNYIEYPPPSDFWRKMGYKFDIDEGCKSLKKYQLKPLPKDFGKLEEEVHKMVTELDNNAIELLERFPENDQTRLLKAKSLNYLGRFEEAIECINSAVTAVSDKSDGGIIIPLYAQMVNSLNRLGRHEEAIKYIDKIISKQQQGFKNSTDSKCDDCDNTLKAGETAYRSGVSWRIFKAHAIFCKGCAQKNQEHVEAIKAKTLEKLGRYEEAIKYYEKPIDYSDDDKFREYLEILDWYHHVRRLISFGRHEEAIKHCDMAASVTNDDWYVLQERGETLEKSGRPEEAIKNYENMMQGYDPDDEDYYFPYNAKAKILNQLGRHEEAVKCLDEPIKHVNETIANYKKLQKKPNYGIIRNEFELLSVKVESLNRLGRYEEALKHCEKITSLFADNLDLLAGYYSEYDDVDVWRTKAHSLLSLGRRDEADKCWEKVIEKEKAIQENETYSHRLYGEIILSNNKNWRLDFYS